MFTGIVSHIGKIESIIQPNDWELSISVKDNKENKNFFNSDCLVIGASIACSGICLTLKRISDNYLFFDVSNETASKTNFLNWDTGTIVNLEKSLKVGDELGGHIVTGHIDKTTCLMEKKKLQKSLILIFELHNKLQKFI